MIKLVYCFFVLACFCLNTANSKYSSEKVTHDFSEMLSNPNQSGKAGDSFATQVTRPFVAGTRRDVDFFSGPDASKWNVEYKNYTKESSAKINAVGVFETIGASLRGFLGSDNTSSYEQIMRAEADGLVNIINGRLGFVERNCNVTEERVMARELLNLGRYLSESDLTQKIAELERSYNATKSENHKQHFQISALFLLAGKTGALARQTGWLDGIKQGAYKKVSHYAQDSEILPSDVAAVVEVDPNTIRIEKLRDGSYIYGHGVEPSALDAEAGYAAYSKIIALGTRKKSNMTQPDTFSVVAQVRPDLFFVITKPKSEKENTLLPAYMMVGDADVESMKERAFEALFSDMPVAEEKISGSISVDVQSSQGVSLKNKTINWSTKSSENNGILNYPVYREDTRDGTGGDAAYSFLASAEAGPKFYYWCPTAEQMSKLKTFARITKPNGFSLHDLYAEITSEKYHADSTVLQEIRDVITGHIPNFSH